MGKQTFGILLTLFVAVLTVALDIAIVGPSIPALQGHFGLDERAIAWVLSAFVLCNLTGVPIMSRLADTIGRRFAFSLTILLFATGAMLVATASSYSILLVGRCLQGAGAAGIFPVASAFVGDVFKLEERGKALGILGSVFGLAFIVGPIIASFLLKLSWRYVFVVPIPMAVIAFGLGLIYLPRSKASVRQSIDLAGLAIFSLIVAATAYGLNGIDTSAFVKSATSTRVAPFLILAVLLFPLFVFVEKRKTHAFIDVGLFSTRQILFAVAIAVGAGICESIIVFIPAYATELFDVSQSTASRMFLPLAAAVAIGSPVFGRLVDKIGSRNVVLSGAGCLLAGAIVMVLAPDARPAFYLANVLLGMGLAALLGSAINYIMLQAVDESKRTAAQGMVTLSINVGLMIGGAVLGAIIASTASGYRYSFTLVVAVAAVIIGLAAGLQKRAATDR